MVSALEHLLKQFDEGILRHLKKISHNSYTLTVEGLSSPVSVLQVKGDERLNQPWHYTLEFTSPDKALSLNSFLNQNATFSFNPVINQSLSIAIRSLSNLPTVSDTRILHGVITVFSQLSVSKEQAHYQIVIQLENLLPNGKKVTLSSYNAYWRMVGTWFHFESHAEHNCDLMVLVAVMIIAKIVIRMLMETWHNQQIFNDTKKKTKSEKNAL